MGRYFGIVGSLILLLSGCSLTTTVTLPDKSVYEIKSGRYAMVSYKDKDVEISIDLRGHKSGFLLVLPALLNRVPDISVEQDD